MKLENYEVHLPSYSIGDKIYDKIGPVCESYGKSEPDSGDVRRCTLSIQSDKENAGGCDGSLKSTGKGGCASGAQIYSYYVRYGIWCLIMPVLAMAYNAIFFAYCLKFARKHEVYDYRSYNNAFYGKYAPIFSNLFEI